MKLTIIIQVGQLERNFIDKRDGYSRAQKKDVQLQACQGRSGRIWDRAATHAIASGGQQIE
jgi:hypothetical protein